MRNDSDLIQRAVIRFTAVMLALFDCAGYALIFLAITVVFHFVLLKIAYFDGVSVSFSMRFGEWFYSLTIKN